MLRLALGLLGISLMPGLAAAAVSRWLGRDGWPGALAQQAVDLLADSASHGLVAEDCRAAALQAALQRKVRTSESASQRAQALDAAVQRFLADLHHGLVDPAILQLRYAPAHRAPFDPAAVLQSALASGS